MGDFVEELATNNSRHRFTNAVRHLDGLSEILVDRDNEIVDQYLELLDRQDLPTQVGLSLFLKGRDVPPNIALVELRQKRHFIKKTDSGLATIYDLYDPDNPINGIFINIIKHEQAQIWADLALGNYVDSNGLVIPVAPILMKSKDGSADRLRINHLECGINIVTSRFCGLSLDNLYFPSQIKQVFDRQIPYVQIKTFVDQLFKKRIQILNALRDAGLDHGHAGGGNFTVELIDRNWIAKEMRMGKNINTMRYNPNYWSFDLSDYFDKTSPWQPIVRVIDLDRIKKI